MQLDGFLHSYTARMAGMHTRRVSLHWVHQAWTPEPHDIVSELCARCHDTHRSRIARRFHGYSFPIWSRHIDRNARYRCGAACESWVLSLLW